jgi:HlyD family secretion protein
MLNAAMHRSMRTAILVANIAFAAPALAQSGNIVAPGRIEGAGPTLSLGVAAPGTVREVLVQEGSRVHAGDILIKLDCRPVEADVHTREAHLRATQATFDRAKNGPRPDEIKVGEAVVGYSQARAEEARKTLDRTEALQEGVTVSTARVLEVRRDARITAAQLEEARARLSLLLAGSREEDIRQTEAVRDEAAAELEATRARLEMCSVHAPVDGTVLDVPANQGQFLSMAVPQPLLHIAQDGQLRVRAEADLRDFARLCPAQKATVAAEAFPNTTIRAQVASISPAVSARSMATPATDGHDVVVVILTVDRGAPALPIGAPVNVRFDACPPKT